MGNQQERLHFYIGYLLGMIDADGSYFIATKYQRKGIRYFMPRIYISNTDDKIIAMIKEAMSGLGLPFYVWVGRPSKNNRKPIHQIRVIGIKRCKKMTDLLGKYPSGKKDRLKIINDFCTYRLSVPKSGHKVTYSEKEAEYHSQLKALNQRGIEGAKSPETIRSARK